MIQRTVEGYLQQGEEIQHKLHATESDALQQMRDAGINVAQNASFMGGQGDQATIADLKYYSTILLLMTNEVVLVLLLAIYLLLDRMPGATIRGDSPRIAEIEHMCK